MEQVNTVDAYRYYRKEGGKILDKDWWKSCRKYTNIVGGLMKFIMFKVFEGNEVVLGAKLGVIYVNGEVVKPVINSKGEIKGVAPNWGETKKLQAIDPIAKENRTIVYCFNEHTNGVRYNMRWSRRNVFITNKSFYSLTFADANKTELVRLIMEEKREFRIKDAKP